MSQITILAKIIVEKSNEIEARHQSIPLSALEARIAAAPPVRPLAAALRRPSGLAVMAELKKASPSAGVIRTDFDPEAIARSYLAAGAEALSVLTDEPFFQGSLAYIEKIRPFAAVPLLRKDFIIDPYQVYETRACGADALLLIAAVLDEETLAELLRLTRELGMQALVEVHGTAELQMALAMGADIIGINNRNLENFAIDLATTERLAQTIPAGKTIVAESGMQTRQDLERMKRAGAHAVLVGSHFMRQPDPGAALAEMKKWC